MIQWLSENANWLGALGAFAAIIALLLPLLKRNSAAGNTVTATGGSVAAGRDMENVSITTNKSDADD